MNNCVKLLCICLFLCIAAKPVNASDGDPTYIEAEHTWTITFNEPVDVASFQQYVTINKEANERLPLTIEPRDAYTIAILPPENGYATGSHYTLTIPREVISTAGVALAESRTISFQVKRSSRTLSARLNVQEQQLAAAINDYRAAMGLPTLPVSKSLTTVARMHVADSNAHSPEKAVDARGEKCNLHSWSSHGHWTPVCYTKDHVYASALWSKPRELTSYTGSGYEISVMVSRDLTAELAVALWRESPSHEEIMASRGVWDMLTTMGVAIDGKYAHVWFGSEVDPAGYY